MEGVPHAVYRSLATAVIAAPPDRPIWFIGGAEIYKAALEYADAVELTWVPNKVGVDIHPRDPKSAVYFPELPADRWLRVWKTSSVFEPQLTFERLVRR